MPRAVPVSLIANLQNNSKSALLLLFDSQGNRGSERLSHLPKVTEQVTGGAGIGTEAHLTPEPLLIPPTLLSYFPSPLPLSLPSLNSF